MELAVDVAAYRHGQLDRGDVGRRREDGPRALAECADLGDGERLALRVELVDPLVNLFCHNGVVGYGTGRSSENRRGEKVSLLKGS